MSTARSATERRPARSGSVAALASRVRARIVFTLLDAIAVMAAYSVAEVAYFRDHPPALYWRHLLVFVVAALMVHLLANQLLGLYGRIWRHAGIDEARQVLVSGLGAMAFLLAISPLVRLASIGWVPVEVILIGGIFNIAAMGALRFHSRLFAWQRGPRQAGLRVAIIGSRDAGAAVIREMRRAGSSGLVPAAVFDDDVRSHGLSLLGVPVVGGIHDIPEAAGRYGIQQILLAIPDAAPELVERALAAAGAAGAPMKILPTVHDIVRGEAPGPIIRAAREPRIEDLLGRSAVTTDLDAVKQSLAGRRVLITGAGGSIGSEIARQVASFAPSALLLLDRDETLLHDVVAALHGHGEQLLADVSDRAAVLEVFRRHRPEVVFHAAAHKHVPVLEHHPIEAARVNVFGTLNLVEASAAGGVEHFVMISTDKAVEPTSVMGASKRLAERVVLNCASDSGSYSVVRFGNVLGSRGSVIPTFARQIAAGGPVTVTDARMTRFFMSVEEAVQLVLQASVLSSGGEIFMLEMGKPVRILDLATRMITLSGLEVGTDIPVEIVGRRPGEKLHEELCSPEETRVATKHPSVHRVLPSGSAAQGVETVLDSLRQAVARRDGTLVRDLLFSDAPLVSTVVEDLTLVDAGEPGLLVVNGSGPQGHPIVQELTVPALSANGFVLNGHVATGHGTNGHGANDHGTRPSVVAPARLTQG